MNLRICNIQCAGKEQGPGKQFWWALQFTTHVQPRVGPMYKALINEGGPFRVEFIPFSVDLAMWLFHLSVLLKTDDIASSLMLV